MRWRTHWDRMVCSRNISTGYEFRPQQVEMLRAVAGAFNDGATLLVEAGTGTGKCLTGDTWITSKSGTRVQIKNLCNSQGVLAEPILCVNAAGKLIYQKIRSVHSNGKRSVWRLKTALGRSIVATANHPFLTFSNWRQLSELHPGDRIATVRRLPPGGHQLPTHEAFVVGAMLGDGGCTHLDALSFTNFDPAVVVELRRNVAKLGNVRLCSKKKKGHFGFQRLRLLGHERSGLSLLMERLDIAGRDAHTKHIPPPFFQADTETLGHLLAGLWVTDGCVERRDGHLSFSSASERMLREVQHLLLKLGIIARVRQKNSRLNGKNFASWHLTISDLNSKHAFWQTIGKKMVGEKKRRLESWRKSHCQQQSNPNDDLIPALVWQLIDEQRRRINKSWSSIRQTCVISSDRTREISRSKMLAMGKFLDSSELTKIAESDVYWDRVVSIEPAGQSETFDLTMEGDPNFVANDIIVHNSIAYLLPAIYWAAQNNQRVVISTNTINLQDQLYLKDIPDLRKVLPFEFKVALLKGRSNYLCRNRLDTLRRSEKLTNEEVRVLAKVLAWLPSTATGDSAELILMGPAENAVWSRIASDLDHCTAERCQSQQQGACFFYRAREKAESAHVIIVNHALMLSDVAVENRVLPEYKYLVVDEAHHLEARATDALSFEASKTSLEQLLRGLANERGGLIGNLAGALRHSKVPPNLKSDTQNIFSDVADDVERAIRGVYDFFVGLEKFLDAQEQMPGESDSAYDRQIRLTPTRRSSPAWSNIEIAWESFGATLLKARDGMEKIYNAWTELDDFEIPGHFDLQTESVFAMHRVSETRANLEALVTNPQTNGIYWAEVDRKTGNIALHAAPLFVGELLQKKLFAEKSASILTSATLCVDKNFSHIKSRLGIGDWADELAVGSPFDFAKAAMVYVPTDVPEPGQAGYQKAVEASLIDLLRATQGRALVLFTSLSQLNATYRAITRPLEEEGIVVLAQNLDGSRRQVLETFKTQDKTVLLGTKSFWEGVDVVGEALSCLVIARLPFSVPSDPIFAARSETFEESFAQYAVPEAVLRFRQGFGRLIRSNHDRGIVVVLDRRVLSKNYGRMFIESLPPVSKYQGTLKQLPQFAVKWIEGS